MKTSIMCRLSSPVHGELIAVNAHGDSVSFGDFARAYDFATQTIDPTDPVELLEVHGAPPGRQLTRFAPDERAAIKAALGSATPFKDEVESST